MDEWLLLGHERRVKRSKKRIHVRLCHKFIIYETCTLGTTVDNHTSLPFMFFSFLRLSNILPHTAKTFVLSRQLFRVDLIFSHNSVVKIIRPKTLQDRRKGYCNHSSSWNFQIMSSSGFEGNFSFYFSHK